jgi:DNA polymerase III gamma/tau subunit
MSPDTLVACVTDHLRNLLVIRACGADSDLVEVPGLSTEDLQKQAERFDPVTLSQDIAILEELRRSMRTSQAGRALLDATLVRLALAGQFATVDELLGRLDGERPSATAARASAAATPALKKNVEVTSTWHRHPAHAHGQDAHATDELNAAPNIEPVAVDDLPTVWQSMLKVLSSKGAGFLPLVEDAALVSIDDGMAVLRYPHDRDTIVKMLDRNGKKDVIRDTLSSILRTSVGLKIELAPAPEAATDDPPAEQPSPRVKAIAPVPAAEPTVRITSELRAELRKNPLINAVVEHLGGEIVKVESDHV